MNKDVKKWFEDLKIQLNNHGIAEGDIVYISSDFKTILYTMLREFSVKGKNGMNEIMNLFVLTMQEMVGKMGTILVPVFSWDFCRGKTFDMRKSLGSTGSLGNWILENRKDFCRTKHPMYSFMVWGKDAELLSNMTNISAWGADSPFAYMHRNNAKNLIIDVLLEDCFTFLHYVEESIDVPYRYHKGFVGECIDENGNKSTRKYVMFVRDLDIESRQSTPDMCLDEVGVAKTLKYGNSTLKMVELGKAYGYIEDNFYKNNANNWYEFFNYSIDWNVKKTHADENMN